LAWWSSIGCGVMARGTCQDLAPRSSTRTCVYVFNFMDYRHGLVVAKKSFEFTIWEPPHENQACLIRALHTYALTTLFESKCYIGHHYLFAIFIVWSLTNGRSWNICSIIYLSSLANSTLIILFSNMLKIFKNYFFQIKKKIVKENSAYLGIFHLLRWIFSKLVNYLMNMCWNGQGTMVSHFEGVLVDSNFY
jgi:hypothetical protein